MNKVPVVCHQPPAPPRGIAIRGIIFSALYVASLVLLRLAVPADPTEAGAWLADREVRNWVHIAINLFPFTGIAFLWFICGPERTRSRSSYEGRAGWQAGSLYRRTVSGPDLSDRDLSSFVSVASNHSAGFETSFEWTFCNACLERNNAVCPGLSQGIDKGPAVMSSARISFMTFAAVCGIASVLSASDWTQFRGPQGNGQVPELSHPDSWSDTENVAWAVEFSSCLA